MAVTEKAVPTDDGRVAITFGVDVAVSVTVVVPADVFYSGMGGAIGDAVQQTYDTTRALLRGDPL